MRSNFSPRQKVVSFALAILTLGIIGIVAYKLLGNIFASDTVATKKTQVSITFNNWDSDGQPLFHSTFEDKKFRCSDVNVFVEKTDQASLAKVIINILEYNSGNLIAANGDLTSNIDAVLKKYDNDKTKAFNDLDKRVIISSSFSGTSLREPCNRGGVGGQASQEYAGEIKVPKEYASAGTVADNVAVPQGDKVCIGNTSPSGDDPNVTREKPFWALPVAGEKDKYKSIVGDTVADVNAGYYKVVDSEECETATELTNKVCIGTKNDESGKTQPKPFWALPVPGKEKEYQSIAGKDIVTADGSYFYVTDPTKCEPTATTASRVCIEELETDGTGNALNVFWADPVAGSSTKYKGQKDGLEYDISGKLYTIQNSEICEKAAEESGKGSSGPSLNFNNVTLNINAFVKNGNNIPVNTARVTVNRLDEKGIQIGTSSFQTSTDGKATANVEIRADEKARIKQIVATAEKGNTISPSQSVPWSSQSDVSFNFTLPVDNSVAAGRQDWTAATGANTPYNASTIDYDPRWPGGSNTINLVALRRSVHNDSYNGYTPVGGVQYYINVYTNAQPLSNQNKTNAQTGNQTYSFGSVNRNYTGTMGSAVPYNQSRVQPYDFSYLNNLKQINSINQSPYVTQGRIADNGLNSSVSIGDLPPGIYYIELKKSGFIDSKFIFIMNNGEGGQLTLPISPNTYAEPPSISSGTITKVPNADIYKANGYVYVSKYPWFGWQNQSEYIYTRPYIANGIPTNVTPSGQQIGGVYGNPEMQNCIGKKMQSVGVGVSGLSMQDALLGAGGAYLLKQSSKQNDNVVKGGMIAGGIFSLIKLAKDSDAKVNVNYDQYDCAELIYGRNNMTPVGCQNCILNANSTSSILPSNSSYGCAQCMLQYSPLTNIFSSLPAGSLF